jgi:hypothetical protein
MRRFSRPPPAPSTCDFMYNRQRPPLYYGGQKQKYYLTPSTSALPSSLSTNSNGKQSAHKGKRRYYTHVYDLGWLMFHHRKSSRNLALRRNISYKFREIRKRVLEFREILRYEISRTPYPHSSINVLVRVRINGYQIKFWKRGYQILKSNVSANSKHNSKIF